MKDYRSLVSRGIEMLNGIGMDISRDITVVKVNGRLSRALGRCRRVVQYGIVHYEIELQPNILVDGIDDAIPMNTILHELLHTCPMCMNHGPEWTRRASIVRRKLGYNITRCAEAEALTQNGVKLKEQEDKYAAVCLKCGRTVKTYKRWTSTLETISNYRHGGSCGGNLKVIGLNGHEVATVRPVWGWNVAEHD